MNIYLLIVFGFVGFILGEIINILVYRIENNQKIFKVGLCNYCNECESNLETFLPITSFIKSKGRRSCCNNRLPIKRVITPFMTLLLAIISYLFFGENYFVYSILVALMCIVQVGILEVDLDAQWIPDRFQISILVLGGLTFIFDNPIPWYERLIGAGAGGVLFLAIYLLAYLVLKREGIGFGDVKLVFVSGFFVGWKGMLFALILASIIGSIILLIIKHKTKSGKFKEFPFAPFLSSAFVISTFIGNLLVDKYLSLFT